MSIGKRLTYYIESQGFKKKEFCETFELDYNSFIMILADKRSLGINILQKVHEALPKMNVHWLLYGNGPIEWIENSEYEKKSPTYKKEDYIEELILMYLNNERVAIKINEMVKEQLEKINFEIVPGEEDSELIEKINTIFATRKLSNDNKID